MDVHRPKPRRLAPPLSAFDDALHRLGDGDVPHDWYAPHSGLRQDEDSSSHAADENHPSSESSSRTSPWIGRAEPDVLYEGERGCWIRLGRRRSVRPTDTSRPQDRPGSSTRDSQDTRSKSSTGGTLGSLRQVPLGPGEARGIPRPTAPRHEASQDYYSMGGAGSREDLESDDEISNSLQSTSD